MAHASVKLIGRSGLAVAGAGTRDELNGVMGLLVLSATVSGFVSVFVVAGMLSLHVLRQRRTWALLRSIGRAARGRATVPRGDGRHPGATARTGQASDQA